MKERPTVGIALGAGAARAYAHIGVLQVFEENKIPVDCISGCSMGAFIGAIYATGGDAYFLERLLPEFSEKVFIDYRISRKGLVKGNKAETLIKILTKAKNIEQTDIPFRCVAVNLERGTLKVFDKGPIYKAVRASISMPGLFVPYSIGRYHFVDGGIIERLPITPLRGLGADLVIGVDVSYRGEVQKTPKNVMGIMAKILNITSWEIAKDKMNDADVLILPEVREIAPYSNNDAKMCIARGREAAKDALPEIMDKYEALSKRPVPKEA